MVQVRWSRGTRLSRSGRAQLHFRTPRSARRRPGPVARARRSVNGSVPHRVERRRDRRGRRPSAPVSPDVLLRRGLPGWLLGQPRGPDRRARPGIRHHGDGYLRVDGAVGGSGSPRCQDEGARAGSKQIRPEGRTGARRVLCGSSVPTSSTSTWTIRGHRSTGLLAGALTRTPMVSVLHLPTPPWRRRQQWLVRPFARRVQAYVCVSRSLGALRRVGARPEAGFGTRHPQRHAGAQTLLLRRLRRANRARCESARWGAWPSRKVSTP